MNRTPRYRFRRNIARPEASPSGRIRRRGVLVVVGILAGMPSVPNAESALLADIERLERRVEAGDAHAMTKLAARLQAARGVPQDLDRARALYARAAELGNAEAQYNLGNMYLLGEGVPPSEAQAIRYYSLAAESGHPIAASNLEQLLKVVTPPGEEPRAVTELATPPGADAAGAPARTQSTAAPIEPPVAVAKDAGAARARAVAGAGFPSGRQRDGGVTSGETPRRRAGDTAAPTEAPATADGTDAAGMIGTAREDGSVDDIPDSALVAEGQRAEGDDAATGGGIGGFFARLFGAGDEGSPTEVERGSGTAAESSARADRGPADDGLAASPARAPTDAAGTEARSNEVQEAVTSVPAWAAVPEADASSPGADTSDPETDTGADNDASPRDPDLVEARDLLALDALDPVPAAPASATTFAIDPDDEARALELAKARGIAVATPGAGPGKAEAREADGTEPGREAAGATDAQGRTSDAPSVAEDDADMHEDTSAAAPASATPAPIEARTPVEAGDKRAPVTVAARLGAPRSAREVPLETWSKVRAALESEQYEKALPDLEALAAAGDRDARFQLAELYRRGLGVDEDEAMAITYLRQAARAGHHAARRELAAIYESEGLKVPGSWFDEDPAREPAIEQRAEARADAVTFDRDVAAAASRRGEAPAADDGDGKAISDFIDRTMPADSAGGADDDAAEEPLTRAADPAQIEERPAPGRGPRAAVTTGAAALDAARVAANDVPPASPAGTKAPVSARAASPTEGSEPASAPSDNAADDAALAVGADEKTERRSDAATDTTSATDVVADEAEPAATNRAAVDTGSPLEVEAALAAAKVALSRGQFERAAKAFRTAAEAGNAEAQAHLGYMYYAGEGVERDATTAVEWYRRAAAAGNRDAQYNLGVAYAYGEGVAMDKTEAIRWYRRAAEGGSAVAQYSLGVAYALGEGVYRDDAESAAWYERAAEAGYPAAQYNLAYCYRAGKGVPKDDEAALEWFLTAAENGHLAAKYTIAGMYQTGVGTEPDRAKAIDWYRVAAAEGHAGAAAELEKLLAHGD